MSLATPASVQKLQAALHAKAKESPGFRFYALYDKVYREGHPEPSPTMLQSQRRSGRSGWPDVRGHRGVWGERWLDELTQELRSRTYQPLPVRRVYIPKPDGKQRPLGIPDHP